MNRKLLILLLLFVLIQIPLLFSTLTADENVYYVMAREVSRGYTPNKDFFHAHPPLHLYLYAGLIKVFGMNLVVLKLFTLAIWTWIAVFLYIIAKEKQGESMAFVALLLYLVSYDSIFATFSFGLELAVLFFMVSWYYFDKKGWVSGVFMGLALSTRLHILPLALIFWLNSKKKWQFLLGGAIICLPYYLTLLTVPNFFTQVLGFHAGKLAHTNGWLSFLRANLPLFVLVSYSLKNVKDFFTVQLVIAYLAFIYIVGSVFEYFFLPITIVMCMIGAYALVKSRFKKVLWVMIAIWTVVMFCKVGYFIYDMSGEYSDLIETVDAYDGNIMGEPALASLISLRTGKNITRNMIDLNFQRREFYNYSDSLVIYNAKRFDGTQHNCILLNKTTIKDDIFLLWNC